MEASQLYSNNLDYLSDIIEQARKKKIEIIMRIMQDPKKEQEILEWAASNILGLTMALYTVEKLDSYRVGYRDYDGDSVEGYNYEYNKQWLGEDFAKVLQYIKDSEEMYDYAELCISVQKGHVLSIVDSDIETDDWNYADHYNIDYNNIWFLNLIKDYINKDIESFKKLCIKNNFYSYAISNSKTEELVKLGYIEQEFNYSYNTPDGTKKNYYTSKAIKGQEENLYKYLLENIIGKEEQ